VTGAEPTTPAAPLCLLRLPAVLERVGLGRTAVYDAVAAGRFPAPIKLGRRCVAWPSDAIDQWVRDRIAEARR
jgi:prophage regulatory protein